MSEQNNEIKFELLGGPLVDKFKNDNGTTYEQGILKVVPSNCSLVLEFRKHVDRILRFKVRPDDVWIITYPKCDTHIGDSIQQTDSLKSPRCIKSHLPLQLLPRQLWTVKPKIIYVAREAKDVAVSYFHHQRHFVNYTGTCEDFVEAFTAGIVQYGSVWDHILEFWKIRQEPYILFNTFEEMKKDLPAVIEKTAKFLNVNLNTKQMKQLCEYLSFESMKKNPSVTHRDELSMLRGKNIQVSEAEAFMRKGQIGGWTDDLTPQLVEKINKWSKEKVKDTDYPLPY
ncbi:Sulfotransferase family cytosolic 1B member 1 [Blattella germanica]|nr:Sulfotransferase family cytosolic 1B member 1 [Blattella germanica]